VFSCAATAELSREALAKQPGQEGTGEAQRGGTQAGAAADGDIGDLVVSGGDRAS